MRFARFLNFFLKNGPFPASFFFISVFFANDWIRTTDLWNWKRLLYQLSHNHCPDFYTLTLVAVMGLHNSHRTSARQEEDFFHCICGFAELIFI